MGLCKIYTVNGVKQQQKFLFNFEFTHATSKMTEWFLFVSKANHSVSQ